jgi:RNA polymerase sigma-70 factor (ECF subfamily)
MEELMLMNPPQTVREMPSVSVSKPLFERCVFDQPYLDRLRQGDPATWGHFTKYFSRLLQVKLRYRMLSRESMEDAKQETFLRVLRVLQDHGRLQRPERLGSFVNSVCDNVLLEFFRAGARYRQWPELTMDPPSPCLNPESELISGEHKAFIRARLSELPATDREMLYKVFLEERDKDEICLELSITRNTLRVRLHRALRRFRMAGRL